MRPWLTRISRWNRDRQKGRSPSLASVPGDAKEGVLFDRRAAGRFGLLDHVRSTRMADVSVVGRRVARYLPASGCGILFQATGWKMEEADRPAASGEDVGRVSECRHLVVVRLP